MSTEEQNIAEYKRVLFKMLDEIKESIDKEMDIHVLKKWYLEVSLYHKHRNYYW